jgi:hypothetical protein
MPKKNFKRTVPKPIVQQISYCVTMKIKTFEKHGIGTAIVQ